MKFSSQLVRHVVARNTKVKQSGIRAVATISKEYKPYATAISDFLCPSQLEQEYSSNNNTLEEFKNRPMATATSDFLSPTEYEMQNISNRAMTTEVDWSNSISYATPSSDFTYVPEFTTDTAATAATAHQEDKVSRLSNEMEFSTTESDFSRYSNPEVVQSMIDVHHKEALLRHPGSIYDKEDIRISAVYSLSFATPESDFTSDVMNNIMKAQLEHVQKTGRQFQTRPMHLQEQSKQSIQETLSSSSSLHTLLPKVFNEASLDSSPDALVVTETVAPFRIVSVNPAWEKLCGFTKEESIGKTLSMLQGPSTDKAAITALLAQMMRGEEAGMELTNYGKGGRKFTNRLTLGSLRSEDTNEITHFIGLLKEVQNKSLQQAA